MDPYAWAWDREALVLVPALCIAYAAALRTYPAPRWRLSAFFAGQALILAVAISPIQTLALGYLLSAHLLQNVVLAEWAPALVVLGLPPALATTLSRIPGARAITHPLFALPIWLLTYFAWHIPWAYDAALRNPSWLLHVEHGSYFATGCLFWWPVFHGALESGRKAMYLFGAFVLASPLGLLLALLPTAVYDSYREAPRVWSLSALADQQIAGITMSAEQAIVLFSFFAIFLLRFLREEEERC